MPDLSYRSAAKELLDGNDIPFADVHRNMYELNVINSKLGGHKVTLNGLNFFKDLLQPNKQLHICEIGCGGGDNLRVIANYLSKKNIEARFTGIDINKDCISYATNNSSNLKVNWIARDYRDAQLTDMPDIIFSSLFSHHFTHEELNEQLAWMDRNSNAGFFINDLHRHIVAYHSIKLLTKLFSKSYLVRNDAPLSVTRGFKRKELESLVQRYALYDTQIVWRWAFRWLVIVKKI